MKYYIIAGEASGDLHGSNLVKEIKQLDSAADIRCWGGDLMQEAGATVVKHYKDLAFMGFIEVVKNLPTILNNLKFCKADIEQYAPDVLILVDYPGFNLRMARWAKERRLKVVYYISPQVWAWKEGRVKEIKKVVDKMLVILPFEKEFYRSRWNYDVAFVGHPLVQVIQDFQQKEGNVWEYLKPVIAILPGSRQQEVKVKLPIMLQAAQSFPGYQAVVAKAASLDDDFYAAIIKDYPGILTVKNETYKLLSGATAALVTSGTATLETALFGVPQVVCYKGSVISYQIAKRLLKIKYISLVNLIMDKPVVKELIQAEFTVKNVVEELDSILHNSKRKQELQNDYFELKKLLQQGGNASQKAATLIVDFVKASSAKV
jgi:lipid-A-disaccharide synthase